ncbi:MAG: amidase family protein [Halieaceae bacterium]|jgi:amidase|nr:amidase family protein [Halieaceae bacterium]
MRIHPLFQAAAPHGSARRAPGALAAAGLAALLALPQLTASAQAERALPPGPVEARVEQAMDRIEALDGDYRAVIALTPELRAQARSLDRQRRMPGLLHGEPILLKDNIESRELPTTAGSLALGDNVTGRDAALVAALRSEGAIILGKANLSEWANFRSVHSSSGWSAVGGQTRNAVDPARTPCGSSSGSAVAVALGYVDVAIGTETSGSIVCPASMNGVVGFKPTHGLVSGDGIVPLALTQDTAGPIAKNAELAARTLAVMVNPDLEQAPAIRAGLLTLDSVTTLDGLRVGVFANTQGFDPRRDANLERVLEVLRQHGATIIPELRITPYDGYGSDAYDVLLWEFRRDIATYLAGLSEQVAVRSLDDLIRFNLEHAAEELAVFDQSIFLRSQSLEMSEAEYRELRARTQRAMREEGLDRLFEEHELDVLIGITTGVAWMIDPVNGDASFGSSMARQAAVAGNPHVTLPLAGIRGLPHGISLVGERWKDHELASIALLVEQTMKIAGSAGSAQ